jgi:hypothetical protein
MSFWVRLITIAFYREVGPRAEIRIKKEKAEKKNASLPGSEAFLAVAHLESDK